MDHVNPVSVRVHSFGCKVNTYDGGWLQDQAAGRNWHPGPDSPGPNSQPRVHILNTCAVTHEATAEALRQVRRLKALDPACTVVVTGCSAQVDTGQLEQEAAVDLIVANSHKLALMEILERYLRGEVKERVFKQNMFLPAAKLNDGLAGVGSTQIGRTRAFVKIQDGCNSFCSFCVIPFARGPSRSLSAQELTERIAELVRSGVREVVLTGVHIGDYRDNKIDLVALVQKICLETKLSRLRLSSLEPIELTEPLLELHQSEPLCPHFHMSIQSAQTKVLKDMRRNYGSSEVERALSQIAQKIPRAFVGMDVIAGFPGETDQEFGETFKRLADLPWTRMHVFPYSERASTQAARRTDQLPQRVRAERARRLRELSSQRYLARAQEEIGRRHQVLILQNRAKLPQGLSRHYWPVVLRPSLSTKLIVGEEHEMVVRGVDPEASRSRLDAPLWGELL